MKDKVIQPEGNFYDKYNNDNFIVKILMNGFFSSMRELLMLTPPEDLRHGM